ALSGRLADPREWASASPPPADSVVIDDALLARPPLEAAETPDWSGSIRRLPRSDPLPLDLRGVVLLRLHDQVTTDDIVPWGAQTHALLADLESLADWAFAPLETGFAARARAHRGGFVVAGEQYGVGSRSPYPAMVLRALAVQAVLARSF